VRFTIVFLGVLLIIGNVSCSKSEDSYTVDEIRSYAETLGIPKEELYFIKPELQAEYMEMGQPNSIVLNRNHERLLIGTCYEEFPFFLDKFNEFKSQVKDTLTMYDRKGERRPSEIFKSFDSEFNTALDSLKKYYVFYFYFSKYAESMDKKIMPGIDKYRDSVQYYFINVDKISG
jgi:hypothetical protein